MLSPDQLKVYADIAVSLLGAGGFGAIVLAVIGIKKAASEKPAEPAPSIGPGGMQHLAGMLVGEHFGMQLLEKLQGLNDGVRSLVRAQEEEARAVREAAEDRRNSTRRLCEELDSLTDAMRASKPGH